MWDWVYTRRVLAAGNPNCFEKQEFIESLFAPFREVPEPLSDAQVLLSPGTPQYVSSDKIGSNLILLDVPDFDTGLKDEYFNRDTIKPVLEASDLLVYIFTNATYNNRDNTLFMAEMLTRYGRKKCYLVYRVYDSYSDDEVLSHSTTLAKNLYGDEYVDFVQGVYRTSDNNEVASGNALMTLIPVSDNLGSVHHELTALNPREARLEELQGQISELVSDAEKSIRAAEYELGRISVYSDTLRIRESWAVTDALKLFPQSRIMGCFMDQWNRTSPRHLRWMRSAGKLLSTPVNGAKKTVKKVREKFGTIDKNKEPELTEEDVKNGVFESLNSLRADILGKSFHTNFKCDDPEGQELLQKIDVLNSSVKNEFDQEKFPYAEDKGEEIFVYTDIPDGLKICVKNLRADLSSDLDEQVGSIVKSFPDVPESVEDKIKQVVDEFRADMTFPQKLRETFFASLSAAPSILAVTYVLATSDYVGGGGILAKLTGLFGLNDLWAVIAIPVSAGLSKKDRDQLANLLTPCFEAWFSDRTKMIRTFMRSTVTEDLFAVAEKVQTQSRGPVAEVKTAIEKLNNSLIGDQL